VGVCKLSWIPTPLSAELFHFHITLPLLKPFSVHEHHENQKKRNRVDPDSDEDVEDAVGLRV
jgi:hypothetical protein